MQQKHSPHKIHYDHKRTTNRMRLAGFVNASPSAFRLLSQEESADLVFGLNFLQLSLGILRAARHPAT